MRICRIAVELPRSGRAATLSRHRRHAHEAIGVAVIPAWMAMDGTLLTELVQDSAEFGGG
jgi:hypothetical protein